ncbi:MAG: response regulator [Dehalobacterium sp.]
MAHILVIDDEPNIRLMLKMALTEEGHEISTAKTGQEGLKIIKDRQPDLILIDLNMPVLNGREFIVLMRSDIRFRHIPIFLLTGSLAGTEDFPPAESYQGLFEKPFDIFDLAKTVTNQLTVNIVV